MSFVTNSWVVTPWLRNAALEVLVQLTPSSRKSCADPSNFVLETRRTVSGIVYAVRSSQQVAVPAADSESILLSQTLGLFSSNRQEVKEFSFFLQVNLLQSRKPGQTWFWLTAEGCCFWVHNQTISFGLLNFFLFRLNKKQISEQF